MNVCTALIQTLPSLSENKCPQFMALYVSSCNKYWLCWESYTCIASAIDLNIFKWSEQRLLNKEDKF